MRRFATPVLFLLMPFAVFLAIFHPATLDVGNAGWLIRGTDNGENALGLHAWLHEPARQASPRTTLLNAPEGVGLLFTDSNPLVAGLAKPFASLLPADAQLVGPWVLLCLILNVVFAWLLLRRHAPDRLALWAGTFLLAFPPTLAARYLHVNLMAHWTILAALWLFLDPVRGRRFGWWAGLIAVTTLIHSYLLVMVAAIWASAWLRLAWRGGWGAGWRDVPWRIGQGLAMLALVAVIARWLGVGGGYIHSGLYGMYAMPLDALWNPAYGNFSKVLPAIAQREGRGVEGFQYLGLGVLLLIGCALWATRSDAPRRQRALYARLRWLLPALVVLTLLAVGNRPDFAGVELANVALPGWAIDALDAVRASGRLFWPVAFVLVLAALLPVFRWRRHAGTVLMILLVVQVVDISGLWRFVRGISAEAGRHQLYVRTLDPRWDGLVANARDIAFIPGDPVKDLALYQELAWRAAKAGRPMTSVYAARTTEATAARLHAEEEAFVAGALVPGRLYVILPGARMPPAGPGLSIAVDGVTIIPAPWRRSAS